MGEPAAVFEIIHASLRNQEPRLTVPMNQRFRRNETIRDIDRLCGGLGWQHEYRESVYDIETPAGKWKFYTDTLPLEVYHMPLGREEYHLQHRMFLSMTDTVEYIRRHDQGLAKEKEEAKSLNRMLQDARRSYIQKIREPAKAACGK